MKTRPTPCTLGRMTASGAMVVALLTLGFLAAGTHLSTAQEKSTPNQMQGSVIKVPVDVVNVFFIAKDKHGGIVSDLNRNEIKVEEDGKAQEITFFDKETTVPLTIAMMIDTSGSIAAQDILSLEQEGAIEFIHAVMRKGDLSLVINFDLSIDLDEDLTDNMPALERAIKSTRIRSGGYPGPIHTNVGGTHLYDAIVLAGDEKLRSEAGRKVMVLVTDGEDEGSKYKLNDALVAAQKANTIIYPIYFQPARSTHFSIGYGQPQFSGDAGVLNKLAEETGGKAYYPRSMEDLRKTFEQIKTELHQQYRLGYAPANISRDGSFRKINVRCERREVKIVARKGYYASRD
ncbi:MAG: VWA domain-containing protein [Acidobacteriia bacterium]|nr:VWA domain-containing protein [Terriglobia bacterium]